MESHINFYDNYRKFYSILHLQKISDDVEISDFPKEIKRLFCCFFNAFYVS